jgi:ribosomal protein S18 acetylase RimI-like enzyme
MKFNNHDEKKFDTFKKILNQIKTKKCLLQLIVEGNVIGCGLGVLEDKFIGLFDIVVNPDFRGKGYGKKIVETIISWGKNQGAEIAYLQVMLNNPVALKLYEKIGFKEEYKYWYMVKTI